MEAVRKGPISINKAALLHRVPPTTLKDRLSGRVAHGTKSGPVRYLDDEEEHALAAPDSLFLRWWHFNSAIKKLTCGTGHYSDDCVSI